LALKRVLLHENRLKNKRALITGGAGGIGLETARQFLTEGSRAAITSANPATIETARAALGAELSVTRQKAVAEAVRQVFGGLDIVFVNAGVADFRPFDRRRE
jgi:NAD(P)-dependent dehydrogenase (short-subunit alcohol dehydrogenase family)